MGHNQNSAQNRRFYYVRVFAGVVSWVAIMGFLYERLEDPLFSSHRSLVQDAWHVLWLVLTIGPVLFLYFMREIRNEKRQLQIVADKNSKFESLFNQTSTSIVVVDPEGRLLRFNPIFTEISGYSSEELQVLGAGPLFTILGIDHVEQRLKDSLTSNNHREFEGVMKTKDTSLRVMMNTIIPMWKFKEVGGYYIVMRDVTEERDAQRRVWKMAHFDTLTGLSNRGMFVTWLEDAIRAAETSKEQFAVLSVDLDGFKNINDALGHAVGDEVLRIIGARLEGCVQERGLVARLGGDEFSIVISDVLDIDDVTELAWKVLQNLRRPAQVDKYELALGASIGIATFPVSGDSVTSLLQNADKAMYEAKRNGRNRYEIHMASMQKVAYSRLRLENDLRRALQEEANNLYVEYQPQVDVRTGHVVSAEALVRWRHPILGQVSPGEFVPVAEEIGVIHQLDGLVLKSVCADLRKWLDEDRIVVPVGVNVSGTELGEEGFAANFLRVLTGYGIPPELIEIEITETTLARNEERVRLSLAKLREVGVKVSVDDFGRGYNSLGMLKQFDLDRLKIDRMFVSQVHDELIDRSIVAAMITLAHARKWIVIAEGVESDETLEVLKMEQCDVYQGYFFSRSVPAKIFEENWLPLRNLSHV